MFKQKHLYYILLLWFVVTFSCQAQEFTAIDNLAVKRGFNGTIAVKHKDSTVFIKGYGFADYENTIPCDKNTVYRIASVTKQFTAVAILQLKEEGLLSLDDPIIKYLPDYPLEIGQQVTIHHLLNNSSGIPDYVKYPAPYEVLLGGLPTDELIDLFKDKPLDFIPGEKYVYSSSNYIILGRIIEKISAHSYTDYIQAHIVAKIPLMHTTYRGVSRCPLEALGYTINKDGQIIKAVNLHNSLAFASGGLTSTVEDLLIWNKALTDGDVISKESVALMKTPLISRDGDPKKSYGYGFEIDEQTNGKRIFHYGSLMGFRSLLVEYPNEEIVIVILSNHDFVKDVINSLESALLSQIKVSLN